MIPLRTQLDFSKAARAAFGFLVTECGFRLLDREATIVRYGREQVFLRVYHGRSSYELGVEAGLVGSSAPGYSLEEFMRLSNPEEAARLRVWTATTPQELRVGLGQLAAQVEHYVLPALAGNPEVFGELLRQRQAWSKAYAAEVLARQIRPRAEQAFRERDYARVVELLSEVEGELTPAEKQKLDYARRRIAE